MPQAFGVVHDPFLGSGLPVLSGDHIALILVQAVNEIVGVLGLLGDLLDALECGRLLYADVGSFGRSCPEGGSAASTTAADLTRATLVAEIAAARTAVTSDQPLHQSQRFLRAADAQILLDHGPFAHRKHLLYAILPYFFSIWTLVMVVMDP